MPQPLRTAESAGAVDDGRRPGRARLAGELLDPDAARYARLHAAAIAVLVLCSLLGQVSRLVFHHDHLFGLVRDFDLNNERNVPTWFQSASLLLGAALLELASRARRLVAPGESRCWRVLAIGLALLSLDEAVSIHERMTLPTSALPYVPAFHPFSWVVPGLAVVIAAVVAFLPWLRTLPPRTGRLLALAGVIYVGGAVGLEAAGGVQAIVIGTDTWLYVWTYTAEETLEMVGMLVLNVTMIDYLRSAGVELAMRRDPA